MGGLGAGILSIPWTSAGASVLPAVAILFLVLLLNYWTIMILIEGGERYQVFDLGALLNKVAKIGPLADKYVNVLIWISSFMCLIGYLIIIGDKLAFTSQFAILVNVYLFGLVFYLGMYPPDEDKAQKGENDASSGSLCYFAISKGGVSMCSAMMMAITIQMCVLPFYEELEDRSVEKFRTIMKKSFAFLFLLFAGFLYLSLLAFGNGVDSNVLKDFPSNNLGKLAQVGMAGVVLSVYPLMVMPMVAPVKTQYGASVSAFATVGIVLIAMFIA